MSAPMPEAVARLPRYGALPVPATVWYSPETGVPDFRVIDPNKVDDLIRRRGCGLCGEPLGYWLFFVGGERSLSSGVFRDPPMHEDCARYAAETCPFLAGRTAEMRDLAGRHEGLVESYAAVETLERVGLYRTRRFVVRQTRTQGELLIAAPAKSIEWLRNPPPEHFYETGGPR